jgi:exosortase/archaeosortase family protein
MAHEPETSETAEEAAPETAADDAPESPRGSILRFVLLFVVGLAAFQLLFLKVILESSLFQSYLEATAAVSTAILRILGFDAAHRGSYIALTGGGVDIQRGCDGLQAAMLYAIAVLSFPVRWRSRLVGALVGILAILILNLVRVVTLVILQVHAPGFFPTAHISVWPILIIFASILLWILWARRALGARGRG